MRRDGLVETMRGREGGYWLARPPQAISYGEIVRLTRGSLGLLPCASRLAYEQCRIASARISAGCTGRC